MAKLKKMATQATAAEDQAAGAVHSSTAASKTHSFSRTIAQEHGEKAAVLLQYLAIKHNETEDYLDTARVFSWVRCGHGIGSPSRTKAELDSLSLQPLRLAVPGCGNLLHRLGAPVAHTSRHPGNLCPINLRHSGWIVSLQSESHVCWVRYVLDRPCGVVCKHLGSAVSRVDVLRSQMDVHSF